MHFSPLMTSPWSCSTCRTCPHVDLVFLVRPAADDNVIYPCKNSLTVPDGPVHKLMERHCSIPQPKRHPHIIKEAEGGWWCLSSALLMGWAESGGSSFLGQSWKKLCNPWPSPQNQACWAAGSVAMPKNYKKYYRKQLILSHMLPPSEMFFKCRRCSMKN